MSVETSSTTRAVKRDGMAKIAAASFIGSAIEWYDFFLFGTAAALVFGKLFFPGADPLSGTLLAFATFGVGFFARPLGGIIAGHLGDRIGRKKTLVGTLLLMGAATAAVGILPSYAAVGAWAPILLVALRLCQGLGVGGEWGGAALLAVEHAPASKRGFYGSWPQMGIPAGLLLSSGAFALVTALPEGDFLSWGWRVPFLASAVLVIVGLIIRAKISEPPAFKKILESKTQVKHPIMEVLRNYPKEVALSAGIRFADNVLYYVFATFGLTYMTAELGLPKSMALAGVLVASAIELITMPLFGALSDRIGRRPVVLMGAVIMVAMAFPFFWLVGTGSSLAIIIACTITIAGAHSMVFAPLSAWFSELFGAGVRYSGVSVGFQMGSLIAGAPTPLLATYLLSINGGAYWPVALMVIVAGLVTLVSALIARDHSKNGASESM
ncbi:MFS transporter [Pseudarthrobacter oxydans]|uniref:MFS transporter n=1 Tax=Pseudarthrobacter oxydans TaxID=1671 RepID=UPI002AA69CB6|nr:MFS transporter [Pseudarthrobacter oxydans]WPU11156.1 MFS transporter [Pseudarthrobacter oxydans]